MDRCPCAERSRAIVAGASPAARAAGPRGARSRCRDGVRARFRPLATSDVARIDDDPSVRTAFPHQVPNPRRIAMWSGAAAGATGAAAYRHACVSPGTPGWASARCPWHRPWHWHWGQRGCVRVSRRPCGAGDTADCRGRRGREVDADGASCRRLTRERHRASSPAPTARRWRRQLPPLRLRSRSRPPPPRPQRAWRSNMPRAPRPARARSAVRVRSSRCIAACKRSAANPGGNRTPNVNACVLPIASTDAQRYLKVLKCTLSSLLLARRLASPSGGAKSIGAGQWPLCGAARRLGDDAGRRTSSLPARRLGAAHCCNIHPDSLRGCDQRLIW